MSDREGERSHRGERDEKRHHHHRSHSSSHKRSRHDKDDDRRRDRDDEDRDRKRSRSSSSSSSSGRSSSSKSGRDGKRDSHKHKHRRHHSDSEDSGSDDGDDRGDSGDSKDEDRARKKEMKDEKRRKKEKKELKRGKKMLEEYNVVPIGDDDYFLRNAEFSLWLREEEGLYFEDMTSKKQRKKYARFVEKWNTGLLQSKFYTGVNQRAMATERTKHKWNFKGEVPTLSSAALGEKAGVAQIEQMTARKVADRRRRFGISNDPSPSSSSTTTSSSRPSDRADYEQKRDDAKAQVRSGRKTFRKQQDLVMEELAPKPEGHKAMLEKRKAKGAYCRGGDRGLSPERDSSELMGNSDGNSFQAALQRQNNSHGRRHQRFERQKSEKAEKLESHNQAEDAKMAQFRAMLSQGPIKIQPR